MSKIIIPITLIYWKKRKEIIMKRHGYYSCDEGLINILMKEKYLKKLKMKKNMDLNFQMIKYLMKRNVLFWFRR